MDEGKDWKVMIAMLAAWVGVFVAVAGLLAMLTVLPRTQSAGVLPVLLSMLAFLLLGFVYALCGSYVALEEFYLLNSVVLLLVGVGLYLFFLGGAVRRGEPDFVLPLVATTAGGVAAIFVRRYLIRKKQSNK